MPTFRQDEIDVDVLQFRPRTDPITGRSNSPANGAMWYDTTSNSFHGIVNGVVASIGGGVTPVSSLSSALPCTAGLTVVQLNVPPFTIFKCVAPLDGGANFFVPDGYPNNVIDPSAYGV